MARPEDNEEEASGAASDDTNPYLPLSDAPDTTSIDRRSSPELGWGPLGLIYLVAIGWVVLVQMVLGSLLPIHEAVLGVQLFGILGVVVWFGLMRGSERASWPDVRRTGLGPGSFVLMAVTVVILGMASNALMALTVDLVPALEPMAEAYEEQINRLLLHAEGFDRVLGVVGIVIAAPLCEEALFRGTFLPEQQRSMSVTAAVVGNGALFGAFHLNPINFVPLAIVGAFLAHLVVLTESLWPPILAHGIMNGFNGLLLPVLVPGFGSAEVEPVEILEGSVVVSGRVQFVVAFAVLGALSAALWYWMTTILKESGSEEESPP